MGAPAKFLFDVDFAAGHEREATVALAEHAAKLAEDLAAKGEIVISKSRGEEELIY